MNTTIEKKQAASNTTSTLNVQEPPPLAREVVIYHWLVGAVALVILVVILLVPSQSRQLANVFNFGSLNNSLLLLTVLVFALGSIICNHFSAQLGNSYLTLAMLFYLAAYLALPPLLAVFVPVVASVWFELLLSKRGFGYAARTSGMYVICELGAGYTYRGLGGGPITSDLSWQLLFQILVSFLIFRLLNDVIFQLTYTLQGQAFYKPIASKIVQNSLIYASMLPGSIILAMLEAQTGIFALTLCALVVVGVGVLLKRLSDASLVGHSQLERSQELNNRLTHQNERQADLGNRINQTLDSFLSLIRDYAATSHEQEAAVVEITATIEQLSRTAAQIATSTDKVAGAADKAIDAADRGQNSVTNTVNSIKEVQAQVREIASNILDLNQKSEQIGDIVTTINQIAGEIRLLALNATIEASGAGPYGRRFAVVAGEVSDLADRSREASAAIRRIISEIQSATTSSVHATEEGLQKMQRSIAIASQSEKANNEIIEMVERTAQTAAAIALATQQQLSASEQVVNSMHDVANMISDNAQKVVGVSVASLELQRAARELRAED